MKAIVRPRYGPPNVLQLKDVDKPVPKDDQVLIKIHAASVNALDWHLLRGSPSFLRLTEGIRRPKDPRLGADVAGRVEAVGRSVTQFKPGDAVFGNVFGAFAEYVCAREASVIQMPANITFEAAAAIPVAAVTALQSLREHGRMEAGQHVLVHGASGGVGTFAVQIAKAFGATVTAVCSARNLDMVRSLGADEILDYTRQDFTCNGLTYDLILGVNGYSSLSKYLKSLRPNGTYVMVGSSHLLRAMFQVMAFGPLVSRWKGKHVRSFMANVTRTDMEIIKGLIETGKIAPVIDRAYPLESVPEAIHSMETEHSSGKIVITVS